MKIGGVEDNTGALFASGRKLRMATMEAATPLNPSHHGRGERTR